MEYNLTEEQKELIASLSTEKFVATLIHEMNAPIHSCMSSIKLLQMPDMQLKEEQIQLIVFMERQLLSMKRNHEEMRFWLEINRDKSK